MLHDQNLVNASGCLQKWMLSDSPSDNNEFTYEWNDKNTKNEHFYLAKRDIKKMQYTEMEEKQKPAQHNHSFKGAHET